MVDDNAALGHRLQDLGDDAAHVVVVADAEGDQFCPVGGVMQGVPGPAAPAPEARQAFITADTTRLETAAVCPVGETVIGGGYRVTTSNGNVPADSTDLTLLYDEPGEQYDGRGSWNVLLLNHSGQTLMLVVTALCQ